MNENRKSIRVDLRSECIINYNGKRLDGNILDISISGIGLECKEDINTNELIYLESKINDKNIIIRGQVVFSYKLSNSQYRFGIKFTKVEDKSLDIIDEYIKKEIIKYLSESKIKI